MVTVRRLLVMALLLAACGAAASPAVGAVTRFASPTGSATPSECADRNAPCTLAVALAHPGAGDTISLAGGTYDMAGVALPAVPMPRRLAGWLVPLAAASYHIYLFHRFVPELAMAPLSGLPPAAFQVLSIVGGIAAGLAARALQRFIVERVCKLRLFAMPGGRGAVEMREV